MLLPAWTQKNSLSDYRTWCSFGRKSFTNSYGQGINKPSFHLYAVPNYIRWKIVQRFESIAPGIDAMKWAFVSVTEKISIDSHSKSTHKFLTVQDFVAIDASWDMFPSLPTAFIMDT